MSRGFSKNKIVKISFQYLSLPLSHPYLKNLLPSSELLGDSGSADKVPIVFWISLPASGQVFQPFPWVPSVVHGKLFLPASGLTSVPPVYFPGQSGLLAVLLEDQTPGILNYSWIKTSFPIPNKNPSTDFWRNQRTESNDLY